MKKIFLSACFLFFVALLCQEQREVAHYGVDEGLSQGSVFDLVQDDHGFLWVGTADGLNRYDGYNFELFRNQPPDSASPLPVHIRGLYKSKETLWITTSGSMELFRLDLPTQKMQLIYTCRYPGAAKEMLALKEQADTIWLLTSVKGVVKLNWKTKKEIAVFPGAINAYPAPNFVSFDSTESVVWYSGISNHNLNCFNLSTNEFHERSFTLPGSTDPLSVAAVAVGKDHSIWIGSINALIHYDPPADTFSVHHLPSLADVNDHVISLHQEEDGIWCGTQRGNIYVFDPKANTIIRKYDGEKKNGGAPHRAVVFLKDHTNNIWLGTDPDGLYRFDEKKKPFHHTQSDPTVAGSLRNNFIKCFLVKDGKTYIGLYNNCISVFDQSSGVHTYINGFENSATNLPTVTAMVADSAGRIWVSTSEGIGILEAGNTFLTRPRNAADDRRLSSPAITLLLTGKETLLVGTDTGMFELKINGSECLLTNHPLQTRVENFYRDSKGQLWVGTTGGIFFSKDADPRNLQLVISGIGRVKCITENSDGIWAGSENGLFKIDASALKVIKSYTDQDGMPNSFVYGILSDENQQLWISTNKGISAFNPSAGTFRNYSVSDGLQSNEFNTGAYYRSTSGEFYFGGVNGFNHFFPQEITDNPFAPVCAITGFSVFDRPLVNDTAIQYRHHITLDYSQNNVLLEYTALEFSDPSRNRYKYRMIGLDTNWTYAGKERFARFVNLDPGDYTFQVKAANNDGVWNEQPLELRISITPPFWKTIPFILSTSFIGLLLLVTGLRFYFRRQLKVRTRIMQQEQSVRMNAIFETEEKERKRIAGELHDGLGQLLSTAKLNVSGIGENIDPKDAVLFSNSLQLLDQACEEVRNISHNMMPGALIRMGLMTAVHEMILKINDAEKIIVDYDTNIDERFPEAVEISVYRILQEALNNMVKHSEAKTIRLNIMRKADALEVTIADDGKGFDVSRIAESEGLGWKNMYSRVETLNGIIRVESDNGKGTSIFISIPMNK